MPIKCLVCGNENPDDALYCGVCQNVFRKESGAPGTAVSRPQGDVRSAVPARKMTGPVAAESGLGVLLVEKKNPLMMRVLWTLIAAPLTALSAGAMTVEGLSPVGPLIGLLFGLAMCGAALMAWFSRLRCYEYGVNYRGLLNDVTLRYEEIGSFAYGETKQYAKDMNIYLSTSYFLEFAPLPGVSGKRIRFSTVQRSEEDPALRGVCERVSGVMAPKLIEEVRRSGQAAWTDNIRLLRDGVAYRPQRLLGRGEYIKVEWDRIAGCAVEDGMFRLTSTGAEDFTENASVPNFFPGLAALEELRSSGKNF